MIEVLYKKINGKYGGITIASLITGALLITNSLSIFLLNMFKAL
ncbi:Uncharacterised protein [Yersinia pseudotuberculosis]|nr:Uncharacterised protein [Yersinia pseudotuberculosis]